jgi:hypothetical protein
MMPILAVTDTVITITEAEQKFGLSRSESKDFFTEWYDHLPKVNSSDRANLEILWQRYIYHCSGGHLLESTVMLLLVSPLLTIAGLYDPPFRIKAEESIAIDVADSEETLQGLIDVLVLRDFGVKENNAVDLVCFAANFGLFDAESKWRSPEFCDVDEW